MIKDIPIGKQPMLPMKSMELIVVKAIALILSICLLSSCVIDGLTHKPLDSGSHQSQSRTVYVDSRATGFSGGRVGFGRLSLVAIPIVPIRIAGDEAKDLMEVVTDALEVAGYTVVITSENQGCPILRANVNRVKFNNYTWLAPLVPTWGKFDVTLRLESVDGRTLWQQTFNGSGTSLNFFNGYNSAAVKGVTELANNMVTGLTAPTFVSALGADCDSKLTQNQLKAKETTSLPDEIGRLKFIKNLLDSGVLTQEEFDRQKKLLEN